MALFKKKTKLPENAAVPDMPALNIDEEEDEILRRRQPNKAAIVTGLSVLAIVVMILGSLPSGNEKSTEVNTKVLSARPQMASIPSVITGGGALEPGSTEKVKLPEIIDLEKYYVHNGDKIQAGDIIASVDAVQVKAAIGELQDVINKLDKDLSLESSKTDSTSINSGVNGRVKAIYAEVGVDVAKTVYDHGCLMLLSLDGMMSVTFNQEHDAVLGQPVDVELSDGTVQAGRVFAVSDGKVTVTLPDNIAEYGSPAVVKDADGVLLGSGDLDIHSPLQISGYYGTVSYINVKVNQKVSNSSLLMNLKDPGHTADYTALLKRRGELSEQMDTLYAMSDGFIRATKDGIVSDIPDDSEYATAEELAEIAPVAFTGEFEGIKLDLLVNTNFNPRLVKLADKGSEKGDGDGKDKGEKEDKFNLMELLKKLPEESKSTFSALVLETDGNTVTLFGTSPDATAIPYHATSSPINTINLLSPGSVSVEKDKLYSFTAYTLPAIPEVTEGGLYIVSAGGGAMPAGFDLNSLMSKFRGSFGAFGSTSASTKIYDTYSTETTDIMSLIPQDELTVTINIDELDILQLEEGMDAVITMDAFPGTTFPGTITRVGAFGENQGGNTKFAVEVTLNTTEQMLVGMNAAVRIVTDVSEEMLTIPANAIVEEGGKEWVYTKYDARKDELSGLVEIQTGISDGDLVQIIGGIDENTDFYYRYADSIVYSFL